MSNDNEEESETELNESKSVEDLDLRLSESELEWALRKIHQVEKDPNVILQIGEFNYMPNNECYQLLISDGKESSHKVCLDRKYTDQMIISTWYFSPSIITTRKIIQEVVQPVKSIEDIIIR